MISEGRPPLSNTSSECDLGRPLLSNTSSEAGALPLEVRIENDWDQIFFKSKFVHSFLETNFLHVSCYPVIVNRKLIYGKSAPPLDTQFWTRGFPLVCDSEGRPPLSNTSSVKRELCPLFTRTKYFLSQNLFIVFWKPLFSTFNVTL